MAIYELRTYDIKVGRLADYLAIFETRGAPVIARYAAPVGFWSTGPTESGRLDRVNHIWRYDSVADRLARRAALYADPAWQREFVPHAFDTFERLEGQLMVLDPASEAGLAAALSARTPSGHVVARTTPAGTSPQGVPGIARWRFVTGPAGAALSLDALDAVDLESASWGAGSEIEVWKPTRFSALP